MSKTQTVSKGAAAQVFTTKKGLYEFMVVECEYLLPPIQYTSMDWLRDISQGKKAVSNTCCSNDTWPYHRYSRRKKLILPYALTSRACE
jgi:hypothetical protein